MVKLVHRPITFANVTAVLALVVAMSGTGYALTIPKNSVGSKQIKNNSVKATDVKDGSLLAGDFKAGQLPAGAQGVPGPIGTTGPATVRFNEALADLANGAELSLDVFCAAGRQAIGGGGRGDLTNSELTKITSSRPVISSANTGAPANDGTFTGWRITVVNENNGAGIRPQVWVVCVDAP